MNRVRFQKLTVFLLVSLAFLSFAFIAWSAWWRIEFPYDGLSWSNQTGVVNSVDSSGPAFGLLQASDRILKIDGVPLSHAVSFYSGKQVGESVTFTVERQGNIHDIPIQLQRTPPVLSLKKLSPLWVALGLWGIGVLVFAFKPGSIQSRLFLLTCLTGSATLAAGAISTTGLPLANRSFGVLLWWIVPLIIHFHLHFPVSSSNPRNRWLIRLLYITAAVLSLPYLIWDISDIYASPFYSGFYTLRRLWPAAGFAGVLLLLVKRYSNQPSIEVRKQVGMVILGSLLSVMPFLSFALLPEALLKRTLLSYNDAFFFLLAIPFSYGYAILRYRAIPLERYVSRAVSTALLVCLLGSIYTVIDVVLIQSIPPLLAGQPAINFALILVISGSLVFSYPRLQRIVDHLFYGGWYDYRSAVMQVSQSLEPVSDQRSLAKSLVQELQAAMQLECACLSLVNENGGFVNTGLDCQCCRQNSPQTYTLQVNGPVLGFFQSHSEPVKANILQESLMDKTLPAVEKGLLACKRANLWLPIKGSKQLVGLLILSAKRGEGDFTTRDLEILEVITRQAGIALENSRLIAELHQSHLERAQLHGQVLRAGEKERKKLARELHDRIIQALVGLNYELAEIRRELSPESRALVDRSQSELQSVIGDLRQICAGLRPPALDSLGVVAVMRSLVRSARSKAPFQTSFEVDGDGSQELSEEIILCLYRILQEALLNVQKHANATRVNVRLSIGKEVVQLMIEDNGQGFVLPDRLSRFAAEGHFGLLGLQERVDLVEGKLDISSALDQGCRIVVEVPLQPDPNQEIHSKRAGKTLAGVNYANHRVNRR